MCFRHQGCGAALHEVDLRVPRGSLYGFLGANGAGKTTTMRLLLGLIVKHTGDIRIFDALMPNDRRRIHHHVGSMIEGPAFYGHLTARENLALLQGARGLPTSRIDEVLDLVGLAELTDTHHERADRFSLGMKQRLGIAAALLHAPKLLILDEPTNGLDPNGIIAMRDLMKRLNHAGITIFLSSHLLTEIEKLVDHVGVIHQGRLVFQGTMNALRQSQASHASIRIGTDSPDKALALITSQMTGARCIDGVIVLPNVTRDLLARINASLVQAGVGVHEISTGADDLEHLFLATVSGVRS